MEYDITLDAGDLNARLDVSHFHCRDFECLLAGSGATTRLRNPSSTVAIGHIASPRSESATLNDSTIPGRGLLLGERVREMADSVQNSKIGGHPGILQSGEGLEDTLIADGLNFAFQFNELDYPNDLAIGEYRYGAGILYVFASFGMDGSLDGARFRSFWQRT